MKEDIQKAFDDLADRHDAELGVYYNPSFDEGVLRFWSFSRETNFPKGNGRKALHEVCKLADSFHISIWLFTDVRQLYAYYESFGFVVERSFENSDYRDYIRPATKLAMAA